MCLNQNRDLKLFHKGYVGEQLLSPIVSYDKMKTYYPIEVNDLRLQVVYVTPKGIIFF